MNQRNNVPATVKIECTSRNYNAANRTFNATFELTALQTLSGEFKYNVIITEDGIVYPQNGSLGGPNYVHDWTVRSMVNGALGETIINGTWNQGQTITMNVNNYALPVPPSPSPDIVPDSCELVCFVYKAGTPLNSNAEIQQAEKWSFISPDFVATIGSPESDFLADNTTIAQNTVVIRNVGLQNDTYYISLGFDGPAGWTQTFTTVNGTFPIGQIDSVDVASGDSTAITVEVNPNAITGFGKTTVQFASKNLPTLSGATTLRFATFGLNTLVVDDESNDYERYMSFELDKMGIDYGVVSGSVVPPASAGLNTFEKIIWMCADAAVTLNMDEINALKTYLDGSGLLYLSGIDIAYQLADPSSPYHTSETEAFFNDYLHSSYVMRSPTFLHANGIPGDPISGGITNIYLTGGTGAGTITSDKKANEIAPNGPDAAACFALLGAPTRYCGVRAVHNSASATGGVVFTTFGFETIADSAKRDILAHNILQWLDQITGVDEPEPPVIADRFELKANYPNPFNPATTISYVLPVVSGDRHASLTIYNQLGQKIRTLISEEQAPGEHRISWDGLDDRGIQVASGLYFYQLRYGTHQASRKMLLIR